MKIWCDNERCTWQYDGECHCGSITLQMIGDTPVCMDEEEPDDDEDWRNPGKFDEWRNR